MERTFSSFREASQEAARICRDHSTGASLERRGDLWAVLFDGPVPDVELSQEPDPRAAEIANLENELRTASREVANREHQISQLNLLLEDRAKELALIRPLVEKGIDADFDEKILIKMNHEEHELIDRYGYLCELSTRSLIDSNNFNELKVSTGLWKALHNYDKIKAGPQPISGSRVFTPKPTLCGSCGGAVFNGLCRCSN